MAASDNNTSASAVVAFKVTANGNALPTSYAVHSITVNKEVNRIAYAVVVLADGDAASQDFTISKGADLIPGNTIEIEAGWGSDTASVFKGIIIKHAVKIRNSSSVLIIECRDVAVKMTTANHCKYYSKVTDSDVIQQITGNYDVQATVDSTSVNHEELIQYNATDWDFILCRADANAMLCLNEDGNLKIGKPDFSGTAAITATFGIDMLEFDAEVDNRLQPKGVKATSWDYANQALVDGVEGNDPSAKTPGNLDASDLAQKVASDEIQLIHSGLVPQDELQSWADSKLMRHRLAKVRGKVKIVGTSKIGLGKIITLAGVGDRFNGDAYVTGVRHSIEEGVWHTTIQFGIDPQWFAYAHEVKTNDADTLLPGLQGLHVGVVTKLEGDPTGDNRIQVRIPVIDSSDDGVWSRVSTLDAGNNRGTFFLPEINDEVIVGFINNDPRFSVVLGMVNSSANPAPLKASDDNNQKGYFSRSGIQMLFDDDKKNLLIKTPGGNQVFIDDDQKQIVLQDQNNNKITMNKDGIAMETQGKFEVKAQGDVSISGANAEIKANQQFKASGQAGSEVSSSANTTIKGSIVQIN